MIDREAMGPPDLRRSMPHVRRRWRGLIGRWSALALLPLGSFAGCAGEDPPSVLLITIDTLRADRVGALGSPVATPAMDRLAEEGVRFEACFTVVPTTLASHAAMMTGRYPRELGVPRNGFPLPPDVPTLAERARETGLATAAFVSSFALDPRFGLDRGFDRYDAHYSREESLDQDWRPGDETVAAALQWLEETAGTPFFLWIHLFEPHFPYDPPDELARSFDPDYTGSLDGSMKTITGIWKGEIRPSRRDVEHLRALYDAEVAHVDRIVGRLLARFDSMNAGANAWIFLTSDHGESLGEHDYFFDHGRHLYDTDLRVPLLVRPPAENREIRRGASVSTPVRTIDIHRTILDLWGAPDEGARGASLLPLLRGQAPEETHTLFAEATKPHFIERPGRWPNEEKARAIRTERWKWIESPYLGLWELYDLTVDPEEGHNLARALEEEEGDEIRRLRDELAGRLHTWWAETMPPARPLRGPRGEDLRRLEALGYVD